MPTLDIDMFDDTPKKGDKIKVMGKVKSIDEDSGEVNVTYDDVSIVKKRRKSSSRRDDDDDDDDVTIDYTMNQDSMPPNTQTLDQALAQSFPNTQ